MQKHIYHFSYDDQDDALSSLAHYYDVDIDVLKFKFPQVMSYIQSLKDEHVYDKAVESGMLQTNIALLINPKFQEKEHSILRISFYHRCSTDGTATWFKDGLLNNVAGIQAYLEKVITLIPEINPLIDQNKIIRVSKEKAMDEEKVELDGINGFYRYFDAQHRDNSGFNFPEIFIDMGIYETVKAQLASKLTPTIVKFFVDLEMSEVNYILEKYWYSVWLGDEVATTIGLNAGRGKTIPYHHIQQIYYLENVC